MKRSQHGVTMLVVLVLMSVMLLGGMALARMTAVGTLAAGNAAFREGSIQASEVGLNTVFEQVRLIAEAAVDADAGAWYRATPQALDADGIPTMDFDAAPSIVVGPYTASYVAERLCTGALPVVDPMRQCLVKQVPQLSSASAGGEPLDPPNVPQYRVTVRVNGPKGTQTWVQSLVTKGKALPLPP